MTSVDDLQFSGRPEADEYSGPSSKDGAFEPGPSIGLCERFAAPETGPWPLHTSMMSNFTFAPNNMGVPDNKKNFVFVNEQNQHKRQKVMRACEGCRRRKIKCDAATTNSWPCAACVRLKLHCVPPTINYNPLQEGGPQGSGQEGVLDFDSEVSGDEGYSTQSMMPQDLALLTTPENYANDMYSYAQQTYSQPHVRSMPLSVNDIDFATQAGFPAHPQLQSSDTILPTLERNDSWPNEDLSPQGTLSDALGTLNIDDNGVAPYITQQKKTLAEAPAVEEPDFNIPAEPVQPGASVRIPPALMPSDETALEYFDLFFKNIYPYMPVISKPFFYQQWHTNRSSISPLLLEAIFACAGRLSDDASQGMTWLALATKHESAFMDSPRLSTVQAMLLLLKAREGNPKRGYFYRSWMSIQTISAIAKDLELDEHHAIHQSGRNCMADETECLVKRRIWQTIFISELMIGGPQGRYDMSVEVDTVDFELYPTPLGGDEEEYKISRHLAYFTRAVNNVRSINDTYKTIRKNKDWAADPRIATLNPLFPKWLEHLPSELQIHYPPDGSAPWLPNHFAGNIHCYYHLSILILHRPQLMACSFSSDSNWKQLMTICYESAKALCRVQDAVMSQYGVNGFLVMHRGINFTIYCILTCTLLHLTAITSPDPEYNIDAKDYFVRHMRILEQCIQAWPMPDLQAQVQSLREAFSADINKPFALKPTFPYGSPVARLATSPISDAHYGESLLIPPTPQELKPTIAFNQGAPLTPPITAGRDAQGMLQQGHQPQAMSSPQHLGDDILAQWNPSRLFEYGKKPLKIDTSVALKNKANGEKSQWNAAFGTPASTASSGRLHTPGSPSAMYSPPASTIGSGVDMPGDLSGHSPQPFAVPTSMSSAAQMQAASASFAQQNPQQFISPSMWQNTVASTYMPNDLKRRWDAVSGNSWSDHDHHQVARPRLRFDYVHA